MSRIVSGFIFLVFSPAAPARNLPSVAKDEKIKTDTQVTPTGYAVLPYIKDLTEPLSRVRRKHDIKFFNKPTGTLQQEFPSPKDRPETEKQTDVIYKIACKDCSWSYIGETGSCFETRKKEHIRNVKQNIASSNIASHSWINDHIINFEYEKVIDKGNYRTRKILESWHTAIKAESDNSKPLPEQYGILRLNLYICIILLCVPYFLVYSFIFHFVVSR